MDNQLQDLIKRIEKLESQQLVYPLDTVSQQILSDLTPVRRGNHTTGAKSQAGYIPVTINGIQTNLLTGN